MSVAIWSVITTAPPGPPSTLRKGAKVRLAGERWTKCIGAFVNLLCQQRLDPRFRIPSAIAKGHGHERLILGGRELSGERVVTLELVNVVDVHGLKLPSKRAVLERGEERVQLRQRRALRRLQLLHRLNSTGEFALQLDGGNGNSESR